MGARLRPDDGNPRAHCEKYTLGEHYIWLYLRGVVARYFHVTALQLVASRRRIVSHPVLSPRERDCLNLARMGKTAIQMATLLGLSQHTVNSYLTTAYRKLGAHNRSHAVFQAALLGEI